MIVRRLCVVEDQAVLMTVSGSLRSSRHRFVAEDRGTADGDIIGHVEQNAFFDVVMVSSPNDVDVVGQG
jgi:hypothetical protein